MRILIIGSGGREHALAWSLHRSSRRPELIIAPGNPGTGMLGENVAVRPDDIDGLVQLAQHRRVDLVVVGPEVPLVLGLGDRLRAVGIGVMGPNAAAARLEGSKAFAKAFMERHGIPTAAYRTFRRDEFGEAQEFVEREGAPIVVKASGLAAGKGAIVCESLSDAHRALASIMRDEAFGSAGQFVVIESFMRGEEASVFALCDGTDYVLLPAAQDHKRIGENDMGPNTGGMGAYAPAPLVDEALMRQVEISVVQPTLAGMALEGAPYSGVLYVGIMVTPDGPKVVEYNCRFGDPEAQVLLPLVESDTAELFEAVAQGTLGTIQMRTSAGACACVVLASEGYPGPYPKGRAIRGVQRAGRLPGVELYQAGTRNSGGVLETRGGRVLTVSAVGRDLSEAIERSYSAVAEIEFDGMQFRRDIGRKGLRRLGLA